MTHIISAAGVTGIPNIDWCETHRKETADVNFTGMINLLQIAKSHSTRVLMFGSGCVYEYDDEHPMYSGKGFTEKDTPSFTKSWYSFLRVELEKQLPKFPNVLYLRLRLPISSDLHPRSLLAKLLKYDKVS